MKEFLRSVPDFLDRLITIRRQLIFSQPLSEETCLRLQSPPIEPLQFCFPVSNEELKKLTFEGGEDERCSIDKYLAAGEQLAVITDGTRVACRGLVRHRGYLSLEGHRRFRQLCEGEAFIHYCRTADAYRGRKLYPAMLRRTVGSLGPGEVGSSVTISCQTNNIPSAKGIERSGFVPQHRAYTLGFLGGRRAITLLRPATNRSVAGDK